MWDKLLWRLKYIAKPDESIKHSGSRRVGKRQLQDDPVFLISLRLFFSKGELLAWYEPKRVRLEPRVFNVNQLTENGISSWPEVITDLQGSCKGDKIHKTLIVRGGSPIGWLDIA